MTVSSVGASAGAYYYLQSLLPPRSADGGQVSSDPVNDLLHAFYPNGTQSGSGSNSNAASNSGAATARPLFSPDTMMSLMSVQEQPPGANPFVTARAQALFSQLDGDGDGQISKSEFEDIFGSNADLTKVDGLFNALDSDGDGAVSRDELTSAMQASHAHHHHHHAKPNAGDIVQALMSGAQGATAATTSNSDGSSTTTISYTDGSSVALTTPATSTDSSSTDSGSTGSGSSGNGSSSYLNLLEQLIRLQAQSLSALASQNQALSQTLASV
jgi:hypothetical protein